MCMFSHQNYSLPGLTLLESILESWVMCGKHTRCIPRARFPGSLVPNGAPYYYATTTVSSGKDGQA